VPIVLKSGSLNLLEPSGPVKACSGIALTFTAKAALKFGSEAWVLKKRQERRLEAAQMKFLRHLLGITELKKIIDVLGGKSGNTEHIKGNTTVPPILPCAKVKERVELYLYSPSGPSWPVLG
jgi:hypothetical protein